MTDTRATVGLYYILVHRQLGKWQLEFGDPEYAVVMQELTKLEQRGALRKDLKIIRTGRSNEAVKDELAKLNAKLVTPSPKKSKPKPKTKPRRKKAREIIISFVNPAGLAQVLNITKLTQEQLDDAAHFMNDELREQLHSEMSGCRPADFLEAYVDSVGEDEAGRVLENAGLLKTLTREKAK